MDATRATTELSRQLGELAALARTTSVELDEAVNRYAARVAATLAGGGKLLFCGNGGSAAHAQHVAAEYVVRLARERRPMAAVALTTDASVITASANDMGFETVFARQVEALGRAGDLLVLHSTSGESPNLLAAATAARRLEIFTVALLARGGGRLKDLVDLPLVVPVADTARAQEIHLALEHIVCDVVEAGLGDPR